MATVSIALCTYNGEKFLPDQLKSILEQTRLPDEIVVCDDLSNDKTVEVIKEFALKAPFPIQLHLNRKNLGSTKNFEKAISLCTGDIIFLSDQDDFWLPNKIELILKEFERSPDVGLVFTNAELVNENLDSLDCKLWDYTFLEKDRAKFERGQEFEVLLRFETITGATAAFKSEIRDLYLSFPLLDNILHDGWIALIASLFYKIVPLDLSLIKYRQHSNQQIGVFNQEIKTRSKDRLAKHSRHEAYEDAVSRYIKHQNVVKTVKQACEIAVSGNYYGYKSKLTTAEDPLLHCDRILESLDRAIAHYSIRRDMPRNRTTRVTVILSELANGNYHEFSRGFRSAALDFVERIS